MQKLLSLLLGAVTVFTGSAFAQNATTTPVGAQTTTLAVGRNALGLPLLNPDLLSATATGLSGSSLSITGQTNIGALLTAGEPYYIEVYGGTLKGDRFDVDTAATITAANGSVVLNSSSANNSFPIASIGTSLDNASVVCASMSPLSRSRLPSLLPLLEIIIRRSPIRFHFMTILEMDI